MNSSELVEKAAGCLAGLAVGDAMGLPTQFLTPEKIESEFGRIEDFRSPPDWHPYGDSLPGTITDDTEQALALADMILENGGELTAPDSAEALLDWAREKDLLGTEHVGPSTGRALEKIASGTDPRITGFGGVTNGASMRIAPVGIINPLIGGKSRNGLLRDVRTVCTPTHNTPIAVAGASAVAAVIGEGIAGNTDVESILNSGRNAGKTAYGRTEKALPDISAIGDVVTMELLTGRISPSLGSRVELALELAEKTGIEELPGKLYDVIGAGVNTIETVPTAMALFSVSAEDPVKAVTLAANAGGDTDTIAAIAGAMAGAYAGYSVFSSGYLDRVEEVNDLNIQEYARNLVQLIDEGGN